MVTLPNYEIIKVAGSGSFGYVFEAYDHTNQRKVALKRIEKVGTQLSREYEILFELKDNKYIVNILDFYYTRSETNKLIQNIIFEYMDDNLESMMYQHQKAKTRFSEFQIKRSQAVHPYLNYYNFIYSENILVKRENKKELVKLCDFGSSKIIDTEGKNTPYIVARYYRAPELLLCISNYSFPIDIWATGAILAELVTLEPIFQGKSEGDQLFAQFKVIGSPLDQELEKLKERVPFTPSLFNHFPHFEKIDLKEKFSNCGVSDLDNFADLITKMLKILPEDRITAVEALQHTFFKNVELSFQQ